MKTIAVGPIILLGYLFALGPVQAADSCGKECREFHKACVQNHSQAACKVDLDICMKHCRNNKTTQAN
jgi:hypothetical protein